MFGYVAEVLCLGARLVILAGPLYIPSYGVGPSFKFLKVLCLCSCFQAPEPFEKRSGMCLNASGVFLH